MGASCSRCLGFRSDDDTVNIPPIETTDFLKASERAPLLHNEHPTYTCLCGWLTSSIIQQPGLNRTLQDSIHEEESLKQIVDRTRQYPPPAPNQANL